MAKPTKIERVETILWDRWLLVRIACEDGTVGIGEGGVHGWQRPTRTMVEVMTPYLLGKDPDRIRLEEGYLVVPEGPGLGIELSAAAIGKYPPVDKVLDTPLGYDGSVQDR